MFCGEDYPEALSVCEVGDEKAQSRHCPNGISDCPSGQYCFIDMPCSYFVMTSPLISALENPNDMTVIEEDLPDPGSLESHYFCGATFSQAADNCSSKTWCRTGTSQECPNGEICFVSVNNENPKCEINAIVKAEYEAQQLIQVEEANRPKVPTRIPTLSPIAEGDERNKLFCGFDWNDASSNCDLGRFCPGGTDEVSEVFFAVLLLCCLCLLVYFFVDMLIICNYLLYLSLKQSFTTSNCHRNLYLQLHHFLHLTGMSTGNDLS